MARAPSADSSQRRKRRSRPTPRWLSNTTDLDSVARNRVLLVLSVLSGEKPVTTAIEETGISRGFYYQLETKALNAMLLALAPGADSDASPDATGLHHRIKQLEEKLEQATAAQRRAERLLFLQRKLASPGPVKTHRGRPAKSTVRSTTPSTSTGRSASRFSTTTRKPTAKSKRSSTPTPAGPTAGPTDGSENSPAPMLRATT
jgi:hypothetical protein